MARSLLSPLCGFILVVAPISSAEAAPAAKHGAMPRPPHSRNTSTPASPGPPTERAREGDAPAPRRTSPYLSEPSADVRRQVASMRRGGRILSWTGVGVTAFGLVVTTIGAVLLGISSGREGLIRAGTGNMIGGTLGMAAGTVLWAIGAHRIQRADTLLLNARLERHALHEPLPPRRRPTLPPPSQTVLSLRFTF